MWRFRDKWPFELSPLLLFCGHGLGEVLVPTSARRPTVASFAPRTKRFAAARPRLERRRSAALPPLRAVSFFLERFEHEVIRASERRTSSDELT